VCVWTLVEGTKQHIGETDECEHAQIDGGSDGHLSISKSKTGTRGDSANRIHRGGGGCGIRNGAVNGMESHRYCHYSGGKSRGDFPTIFCEAHCIF